MKLLEMKTACHDRFGNDFFPYLN